MVIDIQNITKDYGANKGVFEVSFGVNQGEIMGFLGPNGSGKTTTIRQLMGFVRPDSGSARINGWDCFEKAAKIQGKLGYLPGEIAFIDDMSGEDFIHFIGKMKKVKDFSYAKQLGQRLELDDRGKIKKMSKGMKQKIGIVCAFMADPDILILDEPGSGLDPLMQEVFADLILEQKKRGKTVLMSSHDFAQVERTCDRAAIIKQGRMVAVEDVSELRDRGHKVFVVRFASKEDAVRFAGENGYPSRRKAGTLTLEVNKNVDEFIKKLGAYSIVNLDVQAPSLEQLFMHYYGGEKP